MKLINLALFTLVTLLSVPLMAKTIYVHQAQQNIIIDGKLTETSWQTSPWLALDQLWLGEKLTPQDFSGRYKLLWQPNALFIAIEVTDDVLFDSHVNPLVNYWDDDCVEVFIDEDASGGDHQFNFNAFAYHVALDGNVVDIGEKTEQTQTPFILLNDHVQSRWHRQANGKIIWELAVKLFDDSFSLTKVNKPVSLTVNKTIGFMLAYCDNDGSITREHFIGSTSIKPIKGDKNLGYKTADVFDVMVLVK